MGNLKKYNLLIINKLYYLKNWGIILLFKKLENNFICKPS
jgi:hypothetical protein